MTIDTAAERAKLDTWAMSHGQLRKAHITALDEINRLTAALAKAEARNEAGVSKWLPIVTVPQDGCVVLLHYLNRLGKSRIVRGFYAPKFSIEQDSDYSEFSDYDEATDRYYLPEGWHESIENWDEYSSVALEYCHTPTHWMPLPSPPGSTDAQPETLAWAVIGEDGKPHPSLVMFNKNEAERLCSKAQKERVVRVAIRIVEDEA